MLVKPGSARHAAVNHIHLPGEVAARVRTEEQGRADQFGRVGPPAGVDRVPRFDQGAKKGRILRSVANLTRQDAIDFLALAPRVPVETRAVEYPLDRANEAIDDVRNGRIEGAAVLVPPRAR